MVCIVAITTSVVAYKATQGLIYDLIQSMQINLQPNHLYDSTKYSATYRMSKQKGKGKDVVIYHRNLRFWNSLPRLFVRSLVSPSIVIFGDGTKFLLTFIVDIGAVFITGYLFESRNRHQSRAQGYDYNVRNDPNQI
jgi:hypothetical protein